MSNEAEAQQPGRPTLVIGSTERAIEDIRAGAAADTSALLKAEIDRCRGVVRQAFDGMKEALAGFERTCDQTLGAGSAEASAALAGVVARLVAAATAASEAAAHRARAEARVEIDELQGVLAKVREAQDLDRQQLQSLGEELEAASSQLETATSELTAVSEQLKMASGDLAAERAGRAQAEAAAKQVESALAGAQEALKQMEEERQALVAAHEAQMRAAQGDLDTLRGELSRLQTQAQAERAERARLVAAIQQVVGPGDAAVVAPVVAAPVVAAPVPPAAVGPPVTPAPSAPASAANRASGDAAPEMPPPPTSDPELVIYVEHLLKTVEAMYAEDVASRRKPDDTLNRLTDNLRSARNVFRNHVGATDPEELTLFDYQLTKILNTTEDTAFGRHLGIAAYECQKARRG